MNGNKVFEGEEVFTANLLPIKEDVRFFGKNEMKEGIAFARENNNFLKSCYNSNGKLIGFYVPA